MTTDLDTLLIALYVLIDDHVIPPQQRRPGRPKQLSDAELVCLAVAQVLLGARSEHHWLRLCYARLGHLFPYLPKQPGYHKRVKAAAPLMCRTTLYLARLCPSWAGGLRLVDATPLPCAASRATVQRSALAEIAGYGYCAAHSRWYWGLKLYLLSTADGMPAAWCLANPKIGERDVAAELLAHARDLGALSRGMVVLGDKGLAARALERHTAEQIGVLLVRPDRKDEQHRFGNLAGVRQWIESVFDTLKGQLDLERHGGRSPAGVYAGVAQRLLALAARNLAQLAHQRPGQAHHWLLQEASRPSAASAQAPWCCWASERWADQVGMDLTDAGVRTRYPIRDGTTGFPNHSTAAGWTATQVRGSASRCRR